MSQPPGLSCFYSGAFLSRPGLRPPGPILLGKPLASPAPAALSSGGPWRACGLVPHVRLRGGLEMTPGSPPAGPSRSPGDAGTAASLASAASPSLPGPASRSRPFRRCWEQSLASHMLLTGWHLARGPRWGPLVPSLSSTSFWVGALSSFQCGKHCQTVGFPLHFPESEA